MTGLDYRGHEPTLRDSVSFPGSVVVECCGTKWLSSSRDKAGREIQTHIDLTAPPAKGNAFEFTVGRPGGFGRGIAAHLTRRNRNGFDAEDAARRERLA